MAELFEEYQEGIMFPNKINQIKYGNDEHQRDTIETQRKYSLIEILEMNQCDETDPKTYIIGKTKENIDIPTITEMIKKHLEDYPEQKEQLLEEIKQETGIEIILDI